MIETLLLRELSANRSPSIRYALFNKDSIIRKYAYGYADIKQGKEVNDDTSYNSYSVTKTFSALAILQLAQQNKISLEDPIKNYLPDIPYNSDIKVKHLLNHTSGISNPIPLSWVHLESDASTFDRDQFFKVIMAKYSRTIARPNEKFAYSNLGYVLIGQIIEKISGIRYEEYIQKNIINALGIPDTQLGFRIGDLSHHAVGYHKLFSFSNLILGFFIDKSKFMEVNTSKWTPFKPFYVNGPSYGGLIGTSNAFIKYIQALLDPDCPVITKDCKKLLLTENQTNNNKATGMCLSWFKGHINGSTYFTHAGGGGGYYCEIRMYPELELGSVVFFNRTGMSDLRFLDKLDKDYLENLYRTGS